MKSATDFIVVLDHKLDYGSRMPEILRLRLDKVVELCAGGMLGRIIVSGGRTDYGIGAAEADRMAEYLVSRGIEASRIIKDAEALNTIENAYFSKQIIGSAGEHILVVTSDTHAERAEIIFRTVFGKGYDIRFETSATPQHALREAVDHERVSLKEITETFSRFSDWNTDAQIRSLIEQIRNKESARRKLAA